MDAEHNLIQRRLSKRFQLSMVWEGALVGLIGGTLVSIYRLALMGAESFLKNIISFAQNNPFRMAFWFLLVLCLMIIVSQLMRWEPHTIGSGIPQVDAEIMGRVHQPCFRVLPAKFFEGVLTTFAGLSLGREGPAVQIGGMSGKCVSRVLKKGRGEERLLVTCGAGAGMAAAFNAPLTGVMFALEEIHKTFNAPLIISVMTSAVMSVYVESQILGVQPELHFRFAADLPHTAYLAVIGLGIFCGIFGAIHNRGMFFTQKLYDKIHTHLPYTRLIIPFTLSFIIAFSAPIFLCGGDAIIDLLESEQLSVIPIGFLLFLLVGKYLFTTISFGSGAPGGTLFPLVVMGCLTGAIYGRCMIDVFHMHPGYLINFVLLGIAGLFASVIRSPVTAIVLVFELTGNLEALLGVALVAICSYVTCNLLNTDPFYDHLLARLLGSSTKDVVRRGKTNSDKELQTFVVETNSFLENKQIKEINWPHNALVVMVTRCGKDIVPHGTTKLEALDRILILLNTYDDSETEDKIRQLCRGSYTEEFYHSLQ